ncbi:MAG: CHAP domain-containing protein [Bacteroidota bacterium]
MEVNAQKHLDMAQSFVGIREATGKNDGPEVEMFLKSVGRNRGDAWCAAYVSYCLSMANVKEPQIRSGLARAFKKSKGLIDATDVLRGMKKVPKGSLVGWEKGNTVFGHIGFVIDWAKQYGTTIEGNTSSGIQGSQSDGDGVYIRSRSIQPANYFRIMWFVLVK